MIEVKELTKHYGDKRAVDGISFVAHDGEILGFLGPNGAGKSTTMNMLTGYITTLMVYCAVTGESAVGQDYSFCNDRALNSAFDFSRHPSSSANLRNFSSVSCDFVL